MNTLERLIEQLEHAGRGMDDSQQTMEEARRAGTEDTVAALKELTLELAKKFVRLQKGKR